MGIEEKDVVRISDQLWMNRELYMDADPSNGRKERNRISLEEGAMG